MYKGNFGTTGDYYLFREDNRLTMLISPEAQKRLERLYVRWKQTPYSEYLPMIEFYRRL